MTLTEILTALDDLSQPVSKANLRELSNLGPEQHEEFWQLWHVIPAERRLEVVQTLDGLGEDNFDLNFHPVFQLCLEDPDPEVRTAAVNGLWENNAQQTMRRFIKLLDDSAGNVRSAAASALSRFAYQAELGELPAQEAQHIHASLLTTATDPEQPMDVRRRAIEALGYFTSSAEAQAEIGRAYAHSEQFMRESAVMAMGRSMRLTWMPYIERELTSPSPALRYEAARAVGEFGEEGQPLVARLLPLVDDDDEEISLAAIWALGQVGGPHAQRVLQRLVQSKDEARKQAAQEALEEVTISEV